MGLTHTSAIDRAARHQSPLARVHRSGVAVLAASACISLLAIALAYAGRLERLAIESHNLPSPTDLSTVSDPAQLDAALSAAIPDVSERRRAAASIVKFAATQHGPLPNVGALARVTAAEGDGQQPVTLFSGEQISALKPSFIVRDRGAFRSRVFVNALLFLAAFPIVAVIWVFRHRAADVRLLALAQVLAAIGFALLLSRPDPLRDTLLVDRYTQGIVIGLALMAALAFVDFQKAVFLELSYLPLLGALALSLVLIVFGGGPGASGAKVNLGPVQPIEAIRLLLALFLAGYFARRWELLRGVRLQEIRALRVPARFNVPNPEYVLPLVIGVALALALFFLQKDLGPALFLSCVFLAMYGVARGRWTLAAMGLLLLVAGFYVGYRLNISTTLAARVRMWQSPWDNGVRGGAQVAQAVWALATGGVAGTGLGLGDTRYLPAGHTDLVLASLGEELGAVGLLAVLALYAALAVRGFRIARTAATDYGFFLATAVTLFLVLPVLLMSAGLLGITPLTGVVTPFLSYGGSAMVANFVAVGMLMAIEVAPGVRRTIEAAPGAGASIHPLTEPFRVPLRWLTAALAVAAAVLIAAYVNVQVVHADALVARGHLTLQADGVRRFQYNPRLLDVARTIPRGSVFDRNGLVLATGDLALARRAVTDYSKLHLAANLTCLEPIERCYPLGGVAFHLLGDGTTRTNWSASNTSYIERDAEDRLRGFDDRATTFPSSDADGNTTFTLTHDYAALVPLLRHRYQPNHRASQALLQTSHDERVTIDARLQIRVANILAAYANRSQDGKAAAVVMDPDSGELLAVASYPWPAVGRDADHLSSPDALLDRARYGLYPPGSTFKLVTAAAALRQDSASRGAAFTCARLPDGRVGAPIHGWGRPVRDDVTDTHPHGTITMHDGLVESCNAYFAQLGVAIGADALKDAADRVGIRLVAPGSAKRLQQTLPQAAYGQGDVLATPLKMARVAAVFVNGGILRDPRWRLNQPPPAQRLAAPPGPTPSAFLAPEAADLIGQYLRDAVVSGTGRSLRANPWRIAGKTGTAEVTGAPSHSWFVGFAPHGAAKKRIAFAVIIEHAGYGSSAAAPVVGEIVDAAAALGLIQ